MDPRLTPANGRVAAEELRGHVQAEHFTQGDLARITVPLVDLNRAPDGPRDRQLRLGAQVRIFETHAGWHFVQHVYDGFVGYIREEAAQPAPKPTHWVAVRAAHAYQAPKVQAPEVCALSFDARVCVLGQEGDFAHTPQGFVPMAHLRPLDQPASDPAQVAETLLGTPYLWGGNSSYGIDCSGLVQISLGACGLACPGDSDMQENLIGKPLAAAEPLARGDLVFWRGHVAMALDAHNLIHANGHSMSVAIEPVDVAISRIAAKEYGQVTARKRFI